jgi:hypothetical protein
MSDDEDQFNASGNKTGLYISYPPLYCSQEVSCLMIYIRDELTLDLPHPSSQLWLSASGMRGTSMMTGLQLVLLCLTMPNCKQLWMESVRHMMLVWRTYVKYMSFLTP